jgi:L,D-transpeptidase catalytic domain
MRRGPTLPRVCRAIAGVALAGAWWLSLPASTGSGAPPAATDNGGITGALAAVAEKLTAAGLAASSGESTASSESSGSPARAASSGESTPPSASIGSPSPPPVSRPPAAERRAPRPRSLAVVRGSVALRGRPGGPAVVRVGSTTEFGSPRVLAVAARRDEWLGVVATERPNNRLGWVHRNNPALRLRRTGWSLHADLSDRTLTLRKDGRRVHRLAVAIGRPGAETPTGRFAVTDKLSGSQFGPYYGCCILALSGHQPNTPPGWTGGDRLAIHGTDVPSTIGTAASAGCLRASDADLRLLMAKVPLGATVFMHR